MIDRFPLFLVELLGTCPCSGQGVHAWLFKAARQLHTHLPAVEIVRLRKAALQTAGAGFREARLLQRFKTRFRERGNPAGLAGPVPRAFRRRSGRW